MKLLLLILFTFLMVVLLVFINTNGFSFGNEDKDRKLFIITTATILSCNENQTDCKTLATDSVKKELEKLPDSKYENLVERV